MPVPAPSLLTAGHRHAGIAFPVHASLTVSLLAGSSLPTPLYPLYQAAWGFTPITVTVVFGLYALAVLAALLVAGRLADHVGRKPVLLAAIGAQIVAMALFDLHRERGTIANAIALPPMYLVRG